MNKILIGALILILIGAGIYVFNIQSVPSDSSPTATSTPSTNTGGTVTNVHEVGEATVGLGETANYKGLTLMPLSVVEDSRCPLDVNCIQAGTVRVQLRVNSGSGLNSSTHTVKLGEFVTTEKEKITFLKVIPEVRNAGVAIPPGSYRFTLKVEKKPAGVPTTPTSPTVPISPISGCFVGGCSSQICSDQPGGAISTCEWREEYACYRTAKCERQLNGACGWTDTASLRMCLGNTL